MMRRCGPLAGLLLLGACSPETATRESQAPGPDIRQAASATAHLRVVDREGNPLPGMRPVVTAQPNAFDQPLALGAPTGAGGNASVHFTARAKVYLRAWDPELAYFPNNYYDLLPETGEVARGLVVVMLRAASLRLTLEDGRGIPLAREQVKLMMLHPAKGPWWPAEGETDGEGIVTFTKIPPGNFGLELRAASGRAIDLPETKFTPGALTDLGSIRMPTH